MNLPVTNFEIIFNEDFFKENSLTQDELWFDIKFAINKINFFEITNLSPEELFNLLVKFEDILEGKDTKIYLDDCADIYLEFTKDYLKFYSEFDKSNGFVNISTTFENNEIVKNEIVDFSKKIKNIALSWDENKIDEENINNFAFEIVNELKELLNQETIKNDTQVIKEFLDKNPGLKNNIKPEVSDEILSEFKMLIENYNKKLLNIPNFANIIKKITGISDIEERQKILTFVAEQIKNSTNL